MANNNRLQLLWGMTAFRFAKIWLNGFLNKWLSWEKKGVEKVRLMLCLVDPVLRPPEEKVKRQESYDQIYWTYVCTYVALGLLVARTNVRWRWPCHGWNGVVSILAQMCQTERKRRNKIDLNCMCYFNLKDIFSCVIQIQTYKHFRVVHFCHKASNRFYSTDGMIGK